MPKDGQTFSGILVNYGQNPELPTSFSPVLNKVVAPDMVRILSRNSVSRVTRRLQKDFDTWRKRDLSGLKVLYLFLDAVYLALRQGTREKEGVLCAYAILENGKKVLLHLALGSRESYDAWLSFLHGYDS